jgi:para-nitrobenzyl esterase
MRFREFGASPAIAGLYVILAALLLPVSAAAQGGPTVTTGSGDVQGVAADDNVAFKGIPYAGPPVGNLRWRAPVAPAQWTGVRPGNAFGPGCIAVPGVPQEFGGDPGQHSEDCLYLNVWTPKTENGSRLPVMVWIHGGAYVFGSGAVDLYNGAPLASKGAVVVTINYRIMQLGFFAHPALEAENPGGPVNFGLLDQIEALRWVKRNIAAFGGDPRNVTIMGQSAGAKSVLALMASPLARGLFNKAIAESFYILPEAKRAKALEAGVKTAEALGLDGSKATAQDLRAIPAEKFASLKGKGLSTSPVAVAGDPVLPQTIQDTFSAGKQAAVPLIVGSTSDDIGVATAFGIDPAELLKKLGRAGILALVLYPGVKDDAELGRLAARDVIFTMPVRWVADRHSRRAPVFRFYWDYVTEKNRPKYTKGADHGAEVPYVLGTLDVSTATKDIATDRDRSVARQASEYWFQFARTGRPGSKGIPNWPRHSTALDWTLVVAADETKARRNFMRPRLNVLLGVTRLVAWLVGRG